MMLEIVKKIKNNELGIVAGSRLINDLRDGLLVNDNNGLSYSDVSLFFDIEFETRDLPVSNEERRNWSEEALQIKDREIKKKEEVYKNQIMNLCENIIRKFGNS